MGNEKKGPVTELKERVALLEARVKDLNSEYLRSLADFDNFRKRVERDLELKQRAGIDSLLEALIPVIDNFERALKAYEPVDVSKDNNMKSWKKGVELIYKQLCELLARFGLQGYSCLGEKFDPHRAEALGFVEVSDGEENQVIEELCKGYECAGRVIRPAKVKVTRRKEPEKKIPEEKNESKS
jgi:molecular chaperone GrpE